MKKTIEDSSIEQGGDKTTASIYINLTRGPNSIPNTDGGLLMISKIIQSLAESTPYQWNPPRPSYGQLRASAPKTAHHRPWKQLSRWHRRKSYRTQRKGYPVRARLLPLYAWCGVILTCAIQGPEGHMKRGSMPFGLPRTFTPHGDLNASRRDLVPSCQVPLTRRVPLIL